MANDDILILALDQGTTSTRAMLFDRQGVVIEAAQVTRAILNDMGVPSFCKTSGSTGLHIYIPLGGKYTYEDSKEFGRVVARGC